MQLLITQKQVDLPGTEDGIFIGNRGGAVESARPLWTTEAKNEGVRRRYRDGTRNLALLRTGGVGNQQQQTQERASSRSDREDRGVGGMKGRTQRRGVKRVRATRQLAGKSGGLHRAYPYRCPQAPERLQVHRAVPVW